MIQTQIQIDDNEIINQRFQLISKIGSGSFGVVYKARDLQTNNLVAVKIEFESEIVSQVTHEAKVLKIMKGIEGFPTLLWQGLDEKKRQILVLDLFDKSLEDLFNICNRKFSLKTMIMIGDQMIKRIESLHKKNLIYRDIKPENFMIGIGKGQIIVYLIDFGLVKRYKDARSGNHIQYLDGKPLVGTARYVSINTHQGIEQSRRDDLESLGYLLIYFTKGKLPWMGMNIENKEEKYEKIKQKKLQIGTENLCQGLPEEFYEYMNYTKNLKFEEQPDYTYLKKLFKDLFFRLDLNWDYEFDWMLDQKEREQLLIKQNEMVEEMARQNLKENLSSDSINYKEDSIDEKLNICHQTKIDKFVTEVRND